MKRSLYLNVLVLWVILTGFSIFGPAASAQYLSETFESGLSQWSAVGGWAATVADAYQSDTAVTDSPATTYSNSTDASLSLLSPLDFSAALRPSLRFVHRYNIETGYDEGTVEISTNGTAWNPLYSVSGNQGLWEPMQLDLTGYAGEATVYLRFRLQTDSSVVMDGWYIDDVLVDESPAAPSINEVTAQGIGQIDLTWSANGAVNLTAFRVYRSATPDFDPFEGTLLAEVSPSTFEYSDLTAAPKSTFYYRVMAVRNDGMYSISSAASATTPAGMDYPFVDTGAAPTYWSVTGDWGLEAEPGNTSNSCWSDSPNGLYTNGVNASITLVAPLDLSSATQPVLAFKHKCDLRNGDILSAEVSNNDGEEWTSLAGLSNFTSTNRWTQENISLADYVGNDPVWIRFRLTTTASENADGVWLDCITVSEAPASIPSLFIDQVQSHSVRLTWSENTDVFFSHYALYRKLASTGVDFHDELIATIDDQAQTSYVDNGLLLNSEYAYRVYAVSVYGGFSLVAQEASVRTENHPTPYVENFESGTNGWVLTGGWQLESNGTNSWLTDSPLGVYENSLNYTLNYALTAVDLSDSTWPVLSFSDRFSVTWPDRGYLQISKDGSNWSTRYVVNGERTAWAAQQIDLSEWAGESNVRIRFYLYSDGSNTADGWRIDDLSVQELVPGPAQTLPILERFEDGATNWLNGGWAIATNQAYEGGASFESLPVDYSPGATDIYAAYNRPLNLASSSSPQLTLWARGIDNGYCRLYAQLSNDDGVSWTDVTGDMDAKPDQWKRFQFTVPEAFRVDGVRLRLRAYTYYYDRETEFYVDKLTVEEAPTWVTLNTPTPALKSMALSWSSYADASTFKKYEIYRSTSANVSLNDTFVTSITNRGTTAFTDTGLSIGQTYYYKVYVYNLNDTATPSNEGQATTVPVTLPVVDDLDDLSLWDTLGGWGIETNLAGEAWLSDSVERAYENSLNHTLNYALTAVDLSDSTWPVLSFSDRFSVTWPDRGYLQISKDGSNWSTRYVVNGERTDWAAQQIDLSEWAGESNVRIRFYLYSDGSNTADGWRIDDLSVQEHAPGPAQTLPILERFEDGATNWLNGGWAIATNQAYEGGASFESLPVDYSPGATDIYAAYNRPLNLASSSSPQLTLWARGIDNSYCRLYAQLSNDDGVSWTDVTGDMDAKPDQWKRFQFTVPEAFRVDGVRLRLRAYTYYYDRETEFYVDKLTVEEAPTWVTLNTPTPALKSMALSWSSYADASTFKKYEIYRSTSANVSLNDTFVTSITNRGTTAFTDTGLSIGQTYYYKVYVYNLNDTATPSNEGQATTVPVTLPVVDDLDDLSLWDTLGGWGIETNLAGEAWLSDSVERAYENSLNHTLNYALTAVDLSDSTWPVLSFSDRFSVTWPDRGYLQISKDGSNWSTRYVVNGERTAWAAQQIDLSEWAGESNVRIRFYLYSDGSNTADGWRIDDLSVQEHAPGPAQTLPILERFEDGATNWLNGGWAIATNQAYEGGASFESLPVDYSPGATDIYAAYNRPLNLASSSSPQLTLWARGIDNSYCRLYAQLSNDDGVSWTDVTGDMDAKPDQWKRFQFTVPEAFRVDGVRLRLRAYTYYNDRETEFYVDKLTVEEAPTWVTLNTPTPALKSMALSWSSYADASTFKKYEIYRSTSANVSLNDTFVTSITNRGTTAFTDTGLSIGQTYYYKVYVYNLNDTATPSNEGQATTVPVTLPVVDDLDDLSLWDTLGGWGIETNLAGEAWLSDSVERAYENSLNHTLNYALTAVDLSDSTWPVLSFSDRFSVTWPDRGYLQISKDGSNWSTRYVVNGERTAWAAQQIDLSEWAGESNVRIRFYLYSDGSNTADGWRIDDLSVQELVPGPAQTLPILERFEDGATNWLNGGWAIATNQAYEGGASFESLPVDYLPGASDIYAAYNRPLNLASSSSPQLTLWARGIDNGYCRLYAQLSNDDGVSWTDVTGDMDAKPDQWKRFQFTVPEAFRVDGVRLRLRAYTYYYDRETEFYIDRLAIGENKPSAPVPLSPADGAVVDVLRPVLEVQNVIDIVDDDSSYEFEVYTNANMETSSLIRYLPVLAAGEETTSWQIDVDVIDGVQYWWRSRATSGSGYQSDWGPTNTFHVVIENTPPTAPTILSPYDSANLPDATGSFIWIGSVDHDAADYVDHYLLEIAADDSFAVPLLQAVHTNISTIGYVALNTFSGYEGLTMNQAYWWRVCAVDAQGLASEWSHESFVYGTVERLEPDPVTIEQFSMSSGWVEMNWTASDQSVTIEFAEDLSDPVWVPVATNLTGTNHAFSVTNETSSGFYRIISE